MVRLFTKGKGVGSRYASVDRLCITVDLFMLGIHFLGGWEHIWKALDHTKGRSQNALCLNCDRITENTLTGGQEKILTIFNHGVNANALSLLTCNYTRGAL